MVSAEVAELTERIRQRSDIVDVISAHLTLKRAGRNFKGLCPFHQEKTPSFNVLPERQLFKCFGCGAGGDVFKFIQLREGLSFPEARALLAERAGISLEQREPRGPAGDGESISKADLERVNRWAAEWFRAQFAGAVGQSARSYAASRGISEESVERFGLGYAPNSWESLVRAARQQSIPPALLLAAGLTKGRDDGSQYDAYRDRLIFPIRDAMNRVIGFGGRTLGDDPAKYINSPQSMLFDKSRCLYGLDLAKSHFSDNRRAVVVEGYLDCLMAHQCGFGTTVATLGTALTEHHVQMLQRYVDGVTVVFDTDSAGMRAAEASLFVFAGAQLDVRLAQVREGKDPADLLQIQGKEGFNETLTSAVSALEFKWRQVVRQFGADASGPARRRAVEEFLTLLARSGEFGEFDPIQRGFALNQVGKLLGLTSEEVNRQLRIVARRQRVPEGPAASQPTFVGTPDATGRAMKDLLEVFINAPAYFHDAADVFHPDGFTDPDLRQIAEAVIEMAGREGGFSPVELIGRFESVEIAGRITDLQMAGEHRGNYANTVEGAVARLRLIEQQRQLGEQVSRLREPATPSADGAQESANSMALTAGQEQAAREVQEAAKRIRHFAARKHLTAPTLRGVGSVGPQGTA